MSYGTSVMPSAAQRKAQKPCPRCYAECAPVEKGDWRCPSHGLLSELEAPARAPSPPPPTVPDPEPTPPADHDPPAPPVEQQAPSPHSNGSSPARRQVRPALSNDEILDRLDEAVAANGGDDPSWELFSKANPYVSSSTLNRRFGGTPAALAARRARAKAREDALWAAGGQPLPEGWRDSPFRDPHNDGARPAITATPPVRPQEPAEAPRPAPPAPSVVLAPPARTDALTLAGAAQLLEAARANAEDAETKLADALAAFLSHPTLLALADEGVLDEKALALAGLL